MRIDPEAEAVGASGESLNLTDQLTSVSRHLAQIGYERAIPANFTAIATQLASRAHSNGRVLYSSVSGVAHAEQIALWNYVGRSKNSPAFCWYLSAEDGIETARMVYYPLGYFLRELLNWHGRLELSDQSQWAVIHDELHEVIGRWRKEFRLD